MRPQGVLAASTLGARRRRDVDWHLDLGAVLRVLDQVPVGADPALVIGADGPIGDGEAVAVAFVVEVADAHRGGTASKEGLDRSVDLLGLRVFLVVPEHENRSKRLFFFHR